MQKLFAKVGSFYPQRENFRLTPEIKAKSTAKLWSEPREFSGRKIGEIVRKDGLKLVFDDGSWICYRVSGTGGTRRTERISQAMDFRVSRLPKVRSFLSAKDGLRAVVDKAPQAEAFAKRWMERWRPLWSILYEERRRLATGGVALLAASLFLHVMFGTNGMVVYRSKRTERQKLQAEIDKLQKENNLFVDQIRALQSDPKAIEKEAREQLHYARPGEVVYVAPSPIRPLTHSARK